MHFAESTFILSANVRSAPIIYKVLFMQNPNTISLINASAMRDGIGLGLYGLLSLYVLKLSFTFPLFSTCFFLMTVFSPVAAGLLAFRFRKTTDYTSQGFSFFQGFIYALFLGFYAALWVALGTFVYLNWLDHGTFFAAYEANLKQSMANPEMAKMMQDPAFSAAINEATHGKGLDGIAELMQSLGAATYACMPIYAALIFGPFISIVIGLVCMKRRPTDYNSQSGF